MEMTLFINTGLQPGEQLQRSQQETFKRFPVILTYVTALKRGVNEID